MGGTFNGAVPSIAGGKLAGAVPPMGRYLQVGGTFNGAVPSMMAVH